MTDPNEIVHHDENGEPYVRDENGNKRPPMQSAKINDNSGFTTYDDSQGHCALCGSISCRGSCFK